MDLALLPLYPLGLLIVLIGLLLGLLGGGGSILLVPTLVFLAGWSVQQAILSALIVVGITSLVVGHHDDLDIPQYVGLPAAAADRYPA